VSELGKLGDRLGIRVAARAGSLQEVIQPHGTNDAHPRSLSARYGLDTLPFHTELSHRTRPCRYLLLGCIDPGSPPAATMLLDWKSLGGRVKRDQSTAVALGLFHRPPALTPA
jgi:hypothetical protein